MLLSQAARRRRPQLKDLSFEKDLHPAQTDFSGALSELLRFGEILEKDPGDRYVLTPGVWAVLRRHKRKSQERGSGFGYSIADPTGVSRTMSRRYYKDGAEILVREDGRSRPRRLTPRECAKLMGFRDSFKIPVSDTQAYRQFGNSVVPGIVARIGSKIADGLLPDKAIRVRAR